MRNSVTFMTGVLLVLAFPLVLSGQSKEEVWTEKVTARVDGLACPFCAYGVEKKLERLDGVDSLDIRINQGLVILYSKESGTIDETLIERKIREAGFTPRGIERESLRPPATERVTDSLEIIQLNIRGMQCQYCVLNIESALRTIEGVQAVSINLDNSTAEVVVSKGKVTSETLIKTVATLGTFKASVKEE